MNDLSGFQFLNVIERFIRLIMNYGQVTAVSKQKHCSFNTKLRRGWISNGTFQKRLVEHFNICRDGIGYSRIKTNIFRNNTYWHLRRRYSRRSFLRVCHRTVNNLWMYWLGSYANTVQEDKRQNKYGDERKRKCASTFTNFSNCSFICHCLSKKYPAN